MGIGAGRNYAPSSLQDIQHQQSLVIWVSERRSPSTPGAAQCGHLVEQPVHLRRCLTPRTKD
eukprot:5789171-Karenia_brevis.AAC.1